MLEARAAGFSGRWASDEQRGRRSSSCEPTAATTSSGPSSAPSSRERFSPALPIIVKRVTHAPWARLANPPPSPYCERNLAVVACLIGFGRIPRP